MLISPAFLPRSAAVAYVAAVGGTRGPLVVLAAGEQAGYATRRPMQAVGRSMIQNFMT